MSYYPILSAPGCTGWTTLCNFPPNNWETSGRADKLIHVTWAQDDCWRSAPLGVLEHGATRTIKSGDVASLVPAGALPLLSLGTVELKASCNVLPRTNCEPTFVPVWRATCGLSAARASTSYQGEVDPFPPQASLLTFCPLIQFGEDIENYLLFLSVESSPCTRTARVEVYDAANTVSRAAFDVRNNALNVIPLDHLGLSPSELPLILCREMAGIPLYFSRTRDGAFLSLEHTHPPLSYVIHGKRSEAQKALKQTWFGRVAH